MLLLITAIGKKRAGSPLRFSLIKSPSKKTKGLKNDSWKPAHPVPIRTGPDSVSGGKEILRDQTALWEVTPPSPGPFPPPRNSAISSALLAGVQRAPEQHLNM